MEGCCVLRGISDHPCVWKGRQTAWSRISQAQKSEVPTCSHQHLWCRSNNNRYVITVVCQMPVQTLSQENTSCSSFITVFSTKKSLLFLPFMFLFSFFSNWFLLLWRLLKMHLIQKLFYLFMKPVGTWKVWRVSFFTIVGHVLEVDSFACWDSAFDSVKQKQYI